MRQERPGFQLSTRERKAGLNLGQHRVARWRRGWTAKGVVKIGATRSRRQGATRGAGSDEAVP